MKNLLIVAAENSAENYGVQIIEQFRKGQSGARFFGVGGEKFANLGVEITIDNRALSVVGILEIATKIFQLKKYMNLLVRVSGEKKAEAALLIDYPDFNLRLAKRLKKKGIPVYYYISPTVWAWRYSRVNLIKKYVHHMFIIFPFEIAIFSKEQIPFTYTGHPLLPLIQLKEDKETFRNNMKVDAKQIMITLLPGSRESEVIRLLPEMLKALIMLTRGIRLKPFILKADNIDGELINRFLGPNPLGVQVIEQCRRHDLIRASDLVVSTCGTSNLEIAMLGIPFIAIYRVNNLSYLLGKPFVRINLYSIVNILAGKRVIPELIQQNCTGEKIAGAVKQILQDKQMVQKMRAEFDNIKNDLQQGMNPAEIIYNKIKQDLPRSD